RVGVLWRCVRTLGCAKYVLDLFLKVSRCVFQVLAKVPLGHSGELRAVPPESHVRHLNLLQLSGAAVLHRYPRLPPSTLNSPHGASPSNLCLTTTIFSTKPDAVGSISMMSPALTCGSGGWKYKTTLTLSPTT